MIAFDSVREQAAVLHDKVVAKDADALNPLAIIKAVAADLTLELAWLPKGDPALKGGQAVFDDQSGTICCELADSEASQALLAAHEIGHSCIHSGSSSCSASDIDPSQSIETAPVGLQKVEDYGAHERRELQANVFARELLLPRALARRLHIVEKRTATEIASQTGLPINLVRQQLFDALLLPQLAKKAETRSVLRRGPDASQKRAIEHRGNAFQLQAGPGTGKTRSLVDRVDSLVREGVAPATILVLTFSNRAAGELADRIEAALPNEAPRIWVGTFHSFGLDLLRRYHDRVGLSSNPPLFDRSDTIEILEEVLPTLPLVHYRNLWDPALVLRDVVGAISRAKDELVDARGYDRLAAKMQSTATDDEERKAAAKCVEVAQIYEIYERLLTERQAVDFGDLIMKPALLLEKDEAARKTVQLRHRHILVDEYQDVNRASAQLLKAVAGDGKRLWVVGDARQSIYRFRGASSSNMLVFGSDYPGAKADQLEVNYRSTKEVVDCFVSIAPHMGASTGMLPLKLRSERGTSKTKPQIRRYDSPDDELAGIAGAVRELERKGVMLRDQVVLCRSNGRLSDIAAALEAREIPVLHLGSLFEREEVRDLLCLLNLVIDRFADGLTRVGAMPRYGLSLQDVRIANQFLREKDHPALEGLAALSSLPGLSNVGKAGLTLLAADFAGLTLTDSAWEVLSVYLLDRTDLGHQLSVGAKPSERMRALAVWQLLNFVREPSPTTGHLPIYRTLDRVRQLVLLAEERDLRQVPEAALDLDAVKLMTVHGSKGLEFEAVHVPGCTVSSFPASFRGQRCPPPVGLIAGSTALSVSEFAKQSHQHEEECLFFVAVSRAKTHLQLHLSKRQQNGKNRNPSEFLDWIGSGLTAAVVSPSLLPPAKPPVDFNHIQVIRPSDAFVSDSRLMSYQKCPRRYFYTSLLGLGGARKATAFSRTHDCIFDLIRWYAKSRPGAAPTLQQAEEAFDEVWKTRGPVDHGFAADYRRLASRLIATLHKSAKDRLFRKAQDLALDLANGRVVVEPSEIAELPNGTVVLRKVNTGSVRSEEFDRLEYTLYHLAGRAKFGESTKVEAIHLTDGTITPFELSHAKIQKRAETSDELLSQINDGRFGPKVDDVTCPRCPHFFICAAVPPGTLNLA
jgi:DNA helicase-2/ATP-dependent DNA helicase PcrA